MTPALLPREFFARDTVGVIPLGRPLANQQVYVLDARQQPLPPGVPGELAIGGDGVVRGYFERFRQMGGDLYHYPATQWFWMNGSLRDEAAIGGLPPMGSAWSDGSFYWDIPNLYAVDGRGAGTPFATVRQEFSIKANGEVTVKKGASTVTTMPGPGPKRSSRARAGFPLP